MSPRKKLPKNPQQYGPGILDPEEYEDIQEVVEAKANKYGPGVIDAPGAAPPPPNVPGTDVTEKTEAEEGEETKDPLQELMEKYQSSEGYLSIKNVKALLEEMPHAFDRIYAWEMARADGPRIGALEHLKTLEEDKDETERRPLVVSALQAALAKARGE